MTTYRYLCLFTVLLILMQFPAINEWAYWQRESIELGQWWRILTGNFTHTNLWHLGMNVIAFWLISHIFREYISPYHYTILIQLISAIIGLSLFITDIELYAGFSGTLHGLFAWGAIKEIQHKYAGGWLMLVGICLKVGMEFYTGGSAATANLINARVAIEAHAMGMISGIILSLITKVHTRNV
ncbi:rhombosortase [Thaumasiovibrio sp. DFM-14]|uniref:rhombosortase n=1 Tax=Thaumasiovibrio sp. DFM-14 TaxID=3384792 RepID=UPI0039A1838E